MLGTLLPTRLKIDAVPFFPTVPFHRGATGVRCDIVAFAPRPASASALALGLAGINERLIVMNRGDFDDAFAGTIASLGSVPVRVTEPEAQTSARPSFDHGKTAVIL